jgi:predicted thioesterase
VTFEIVGDIEHVETIASGRGVKVRARLQRIYGKGRWRKGKAPARFDFTTED